MDNGSDQKLSKFLLAINSYAEQKKEQIHNEVEEFKAQELKNAEAQVLKDSYNLIHKEMTAVRTGISRDISRRELESKRTLLAHRKEITDEVFSKAHKKLLAYRETPQYEDFLRGSAKRVASFLADCGDTVIYIAPADEKYTPLIRSVLGSGCRIEHSDMIEIGGIKGISESSGLVADDSIDSKLEAQVEWFLENSGMTL